MISLSSIRIKLNYDYYSQFSGQKKSNIKFLPTTAYIFLPKFFLEFKTTFLEHKITLDTDKLLLKIASSEVKPSELKTMR